MKPIDNVVARCEHCKYGIFSCVCRHPKAKPEDTGHEPCTIKDWEHCPYNVKEEYPIHLSCGHGVMELEDSVHLEYTDYDDAVVSGVFCKPCAEEFKKEMGAKVIK